MAFETTKDVLDHVREFHQQLSEFYRDLIDKTDKERVRMLLDYLSRHEKHLEESMARYEAEVSERILKTWFQYPPPKEILGICKTLAVDEVEDLSVDGVIKLALELDDCLIDLYKEMIRGSESEEVREVFQSLLDMEKQEELELVRDSLELKDL
jgi:rubrerythrin